MTQAFIKRDYSLTGTETKAAQEKGLTDAQWYQCLVPRKRLKELMQRRDGPAIRDTVIWFAAIGSSGYLAYHFWGSWLALPFFFIYGTLYGSTSDSRWHECGHGTAFRTPWLNAVVYNIASFMVMREPTIWRWSHTRHHTDTIIVGRDPEIAVPRPPDVFRYMLNFVGIFSGVTYLSKIVLHSVGRLRADEMTFVPETERSKVYWTARMTVLIYLGVIAWSLALRSILPLMFIGLPSFYGAWLLRVFGTTQHAGLAEDVLDHRLNSRTIYMNPVLRFLYWNMNYHVEHHMFPLVPYHALPALHEEVKGDMPPAYRGLWGAYREIIPAVLRQVKDPRYFVERHLPAGAPVIPGIAPRPPLADPVSGAAS